MDKLCKNCIKWEKRDSSAMKWTDVITGYCLQSPFDVRNMKSDQCTVFCGHDGGIITGENFGCIHWESKTEE